MTPTHATRRHHAARLKRNRASYRGGIAGTTGRRRGMVLHTPSNHEP